MNRKPDGRSLLNRLSPDQQAAVAELGDIEEKIRSNRQTLFRNMNLIKLIKMHTSVAFACLAAGLALQLPGNRCQAQTAAVNLPPGVQDVVKLVRAGISDDVVLAQVKNTGASYSLTADQIIYLRDQGVSQAVIGALLGSGNAAVPVNPTPAPAAPAGGAPVPASSSPPSALPPPAGLYAPAPLAAAAPALPAVSTPPAVSLDSFQSQLAPYGTWMQVPGYGLCWRPAVAAADPYWRPYCDQGHWLYTADGWFWQSDYPWGDIVFHYGRWYRDSLGWIWVPAYDWAPAWVCWRRAEGYCGWAPLPPSARFKVGVGLWFGGRLAVDVDFGLGLEMFTFVPYDHFWDHDLRLRLLPRERAQLIFRRSIIMNGYRVDHGRLIVEGLGRERMAALTHREIRVEEARMRDSRTRERGELEKKDVRDERLEKKGARDERRDRRDR
ncbi:MAG: DUF6600 domain-containing protein [Verrucomicrobiota bacterium]